MITVRLHCSLVSEPVLLASGTSVLIGRDPNQADIALDMSGVSKRHCELRVTPTEVTLTDLGSTNGTYVNGRWVSEAQLHDGDVLDLGPKVQIRVEVRRDDGPLRCAGCQRELGEREAVRGGRYRDQRHAAYCLSCALTGSGNFTTLGPYRLLHPVGQGLMGRVYEAADSRTSARCALKLLPPAFTAEPTDDRSLRTTKRFVREIELMRELVHPNIVGFLDGGNLGGQVYLALEYIDGADLGSLIGALGRPFTLDELTPIVLSVASALDYAHAQGVIHRDVKPGNILRDWSGTIKVTDFGLARRRDSGSILTAAGSIVGTLEFMAPEQLENAAAIDGRADVYGLAATAFYLVSGQRPFRANSDYELMRQVTSAPVPHLREVWPEAPAALDDLLHRGMLRQPDRRLATPRELARGWHDALG